MSLVIAAISPAGIAMASDSRRVLAESEIADKPGFYSEYVDDSPKLRTAGRYLVAFTGPGRFEDGDQVWSVNEIIKSVDPWTGDIFSVAGEINNRLAEVILPKGYKYNLVIGGWQEFSANNRLGKAAFPVMLVYENGQEKGRYGYREWDGMFQSRLHVAGVADALKGLLAGRQVKLNEMNIGDLAELVNLTCHTGTFFHGAFGLGNCLGGSVNVAVATAGGPVVLQGRAL